MREHSSRFFNFSTEILDGSEKNNSIEIKNESGNESFHTDNGNQSPLTFSLDLHSPISYHKTPSWNTGIARSVEPIRSFDLHRSVDSLNSDSYFFLFATISN